MINLLEHLQYVLSMYLLFYEFDWESQKEQQVL